LTYDSKGNITSLIDPLGHQIEMMQYDSNGNPHQIKDKRGFLWEYDYDKKGRLLSQTNPLDQTTNYKYDAANNLTEILDAANNRWQFVYNSHNQLTKTIDPNGHESEITYKNRLPTQITDQEGKSRFNALYDNEGHLLSTIDGANNETRLHYSLNDTNSLRRGTRSGSVANDTISDLPLEIEYPTYRQRRYYDKLQRLVRTTNILDEDTNYSLSYEYDAAGNILSQTDQEGKTTSFEYDALERLVKVIDAKGGITQLKYDARDNIIAIHDPKGGITRYQYDKNDNVVKQVRPEGQTTEYEYDATGNQTARFDALGQKIAYQYDALSRLTQVDYYTTDNHQTPVKTVHLTYDVIGNLISYNDGTTSATYTYNPLGQKLTETVNYGPFTLSHSYEYYANGLKKSFTGPDNVKITYSYDENNRLSAIDIPNAGRITYNTYHWNHPAKITLPGGSQIDLAYDPLMRLLSKTVKDPGQQSLMDYEYEYSPANNITKKTTGQGEHAYEYDELYRLTQATNPLLEDEHYTYDLLSNRLTTNGVESNYDANNALLNYGNTKFEYDPNGNLVKKTTGTQITHYEYNIDNRLIQVTNNQGNLIAKYDYDPFGRRIWKEIGGIKTYFVYADEGLIGEYDENSTEIKAYGYQPNSTWTTNPLFQKTNGSYYWYQTDHLGTPHKLIDSQGNVVWEAVYEAFGKARIDLELVENHLRFAGQYFDGETGLHYNWHRYYEPNIGRYLRFDPIGLGDGLNAHIYVYNDPINYIDPTGEWVWVAGAAIAGAIVNFGYQMFKHGGNIECVDLLQVASWGISGELFASGAGIIANSARLHGGLGKAITRFFWDNRPFSGYCGVSRAYWNRTTGRGPANGRSLHHWLFPQRSGLPQGFQNAGWNLITLDPFRGVFHKTLGLNQWMGFALKWGGVHARNAILVENAIRLIIPTTAILSGYIGYLIGTQAVKEVECQTDKPQICG